MSFSPSKFRAASEAAERWLGTVNLVVWHAQRGDVDMAYRLLMPSAAKPSGIDLEQLCPGVGMNYYGQTAAALVAGSNLLDDYQAHAPVLEKARDVLACVSAASVVWGSDRGMSAVARSPRAMVPHRWRSATEAAAGITEIALVLLVAPLLEIEEDGLEAEQWRRAEALLATRARALAMTPEELAALQADVGRERSKLLAQRRPRRGRSKGDDRLAWDDSTHTVTLDGKPCKVDDPTAYHVYKAICQRPGPAITKAGIRATVPGTKGGRTIPNLIGRLPLALRRTVDVSTKGYFHNLPKKKEKARVGP